MNTTTAAGARAMRYEEPKPRFGPSDNAFLGGRRGKLQRLDVAASCYAFGLLWPWDIYFGCKSLMVQRCQSQISPKAADLGGEVALRVERRQPRAQLEVAPGL